MQSPFDSKNRLAAALDRFALHAGLLAASIAYFFLLWRSGPASLLAGSGLFALLLLALSLIERRTLRMRDRLLRERIGGAILLEDLLLLPAARAQKETQRLLCLALGAKEENGFMRYDGEAWLVRLTQCVSGSNAGPSDVLAAHRARIETGADKCALTSTTGFTAEAVRAAEWVDPPIRLISGRQLSNIAGRIHPATDEEILSHARRRKTPFSRARIRALAFSPVKTKRYLLCAFLLMMLYFFSGSGGALAFMLVSFLLAILCHAENRRRFTL